MESRSHFIILDRTLEQELGRPTARIKNYSNVGALVGQGPTLEQSVTDGSPFPYMNTSLFKRIERKLLELANVSASRTPSNTELNFY